MQGLGYTSAAAAPALSQSEFGSTSEIAPPPAPLAGKYRAKTVTARQTVLHFLRDKAAEFTRLLFVQSHRQSPLWRPARQRPPSRSSQCPLPFSHSQVSTIARQGGFVLLYLMECVKWTVMSSTFYQTCSTKTHGMSAVQVTT